VTGSQSGQWLESVEKPRCPIFQQEWEDLSKLEHRKLSLSAAVEQKRLEWVECSFFYMLFSLSFCAVVNV